MALATHSITLLNRALMNNRAVICFILLFFFSMYVSDARSRTYSLSAKVLGNCQTTPESMEIEVLQRLATPSDRPTTASTHHGKISLSSLFPEVTLKVRHRNPQFNTYLPNSMIILKNRTNASVHEELCIPSLLCTNKAPGACWQYNLVFIS